MKKLMKKKVNVFGKKVPVLMLIGIFALAIATAALLPYFGQITGMATVSQGLLVDGLSWDDSDITFNWDNFTSLEAKTFVSGHNLTNNADVEAKVNLETEKSATSSPNSKEEINVSYYEITGYAEEFLSNETQLDRTNVTVEDLGDSVLWTMNVPLDGTYGTGLGPGGQAAWSISIGSGSDILYQVHSNDGTCADWDDGTYLYSEYEGGWHTGGVTCGDTNTPITEIDGIDATGERTAANTGGVYTIEIDKSLLDFEEFKWVAYINYEGDSLPNAFTWSDTNTNNFENANVGTEFTNPVSVLSGETVDFAIVTEFPQMTYPGEYTITTTVNPAE